MKRSVLAVMTLLMFLPGQARADAPTAATVDFIRLGKSSPRRQDLDSVGQALGTPSHPTKVAFFQGIDEELLQRVRELHTAGNRVVMVAPTPVSYDPEGDSSTSAGKARLLNAGADAAIVWRTPEETSRVLRSTFTILDTMSDTPLARPPPVYVFTDTTGLSPDVRESLALARAKAELTRAAQSPWYREALRRMQQHIDGVARAESIYPGNYYTWGTYHIAKALRLSEEMEMLSRARRIEGSSGLDIVTPELRQARRELLEAERALLARETRKLRAAQRAEQIESVGGVGGVDGVVTLAQNIRVIGGADPQIAGPAGHVADLASRWIAKVRERDRAVRGTQNGAPLEAAVGELASQRCFEAVNEQLQHNFEELVDARRGCYPGDYRRPEIIEHGALTRTGQRRVAFRIREGRSVSSDPIHLAKDEIPTMVGYANVAVQPDGAVAITSVEVDHLLGTQRLGPQPKAWQRLVAVFFTVKSDPPEQRYRSKPAPRPATANIPWPTVGALPETPATPPGGDVTRVPLFPRERVPSPTDTPALTAVERMLRLAGFPVPNHLVNQAIAEAGEGAAGALLRQQLLASRRSSVFGPGGAPAPATAAAPLRQVEKVERVQMLTR